MKSATPIENIFRQVEEACLPLKRRERWWLRAEAGWGGGARNLQKPHPSSIKNFILTIIICMQIDGWVGALYILENKT